MRKNHPSRKDIAWNIRETQELTNFEISENKACAPGGGAVNMVSVYCV